MKIPSVYSGQGPSESARISGVQTGISNIRPSKVSGGLKELGGALMNFAIQQEKKQRSNQAQQMALEAKMASNEAKHQFQQVLAEVSLNPNISDNPMEYMDMARDRIRTQVYQKYKIDPSTKGRRDMVIGNAIMSSMGNLAVAQLKIGSQANDLRSDILSAQQVNNLLLDTRQNPGNLDNNNAQGIVAISQKYTTAAGRKEALNTFLKEQSDAYMDGEFKRGTNIIAKKISLEISGQTTTPGGRSARDFSGLYKDVYRLRDRIKTNLMKSYKKSSPHMSKNDIDAMLDSVDIKANQVATQIKNMMPFD